MSRGVNAVRWSISGIGSALSYMNPFGGTTPTQPVNEGQHTADAIASTNARHAHQSKIHTLSSLKKQDDETETYNGNSINQM